MSLIINNTPDGGRSGLTIVSRIPFAWSLRRFRRLSGGRPGLDVNMLTYDEATDLDRIGAVVILADFERLGAPDLARAVDLYRRLLASGRRVLNDPRRALVRQALLQRLHRVGLNTFTAHAVDSPADTWRWPVFLRRSDCHDGAATGLLYTPQQVEAALAGLAAEGGASGLLAVEYCDTRSADGLFRTYSAFRLGEHLFPAHIIFGGTWDAKTDVPQTEALYDEEMRFVRDFPHRRVIANVFHAAGIDYGRIDYGILDGRPQVWEINTLPEISNFSSEELARSPDGRRHYFDRLAAAFEAESATGAGSVRPAVA